MAVRLTRVAVALVITTFFGYLWWSQSASPQPLPHTRHGQHLAWGHNDTTTSTSAAATPNSMIVPLPTLSTPSSSASDASDESASVATVSSSDADTVSRNDNESIDAISSASVASPSTSSSSEPSSSSSSRSSSRSDSKTIVTAPVPSLPTCDAGFGVRNGWTMDKSSWRVVTDASTESDIKLLGDVYRGGRRLVNESTTHPTPEWPWHVLNRNATCILRARQTKADILCSNSGRLYWQCDYRNHVLRIPCGAAMGPMIYTNGRSFPQRLQVAGWDAPAPGDFQRPTKVFDEVAVVQTCFSDAWGHFTKDLLPRFFAVLKWVPPHVPIVVGGGAALQKWLPYIAKTGIVNMSRIIVMDDAYVYYGRLLYTAGELSRSDRTDGQWRSNSMYCGWRHGLPAYLIKQLIYGAQQPIRLRRIVVIDRRPTGKDVRRVIANQVDMNEKLKEVFTDFEILFYIGAPTVDEQVVYFNQSAMLIGAHGAGLAYMAWMPSNGAVLEVGHTANDGFGFPDGDFPSYGRGLGLDYSITYADGSHNSLLTVDVNEVITLAVAALNRIGLIDDTDPRVRNLPPHY